jgi:hypothetical protein
MDLPLVAVPQVAYTMLWVALVAQGLAVEIHKVKMVKL